MRSRRFCTSNSTDTKNATVSGAPTKPLRGASMKMSGAPKIMMGTSSMTSRLPMRLYRP